MPESLFAPTQPSLLDLIEAIINHLDRSFAQNPAAAFNGEEVRNPLIVAGPTNGYISHDEWCKSSGSQLQSCTQGPRLADAPNNDSFPFREGSSPGGSKRLGIRSGGGCFDRPVEASARPERQS